MAKLIRSFQPVVDSIFRNRDIIVPNRGMDVITPPVQQGAFAPEGEIGDGILAEGGDGYILTEGGAAPLPPAGGDGINIFSNSKLFDIELGSSTPVGWVRVVSGSSTGWESTHPDGSQISKFNGLDTGDDCRFYQTLLSFSGQTFPLDIYFSFYIDIIASGDYSAINLLSFFDDSAQMSIIANHASVTAIGRYVAHWRLATDVTFTAAFGSTSWTGLSTGQLRWSRPQIEWGAQSVYKATT